MCFFTASRLLGYYEPLRHPKRPGLSLTSCQLIHTAITAGTSRVASDPLCLHAVANTPAGPMETCSLVLSHRLRPSPNRRRVGSNENDAIVVLGNLVDAQLDYASELREGDKTK